MTQLDFYRWLADLVLLVHFSFVVFVVVGLVLIWAGYFRGWAFVRNPWFRLAHLAAMGLVVAEALGGLTCPLTTWEADLRWRSGEGQRYEGSFIQHWVHRLMFFEASESTFTVIYAVFFLLIALSFWLVRPRWPPRRDRLEAPLKRSGAMGHGRDRAGGKVGK
jgi:hypothetical protein